MRNMPRLVSLAVLLLLIVILGITFYKVIAPFVLPLFLAAMTAIVAQPLFRYFLNRSGNRLALASGLTTFTLMAAVLVPLITATAIASLQLYTFASETDAESIQKIVEQGVETVNRFRPEGEKLTSKEISQHVSTWFKSSMTEIGDKSLGRAAGTTWGALTGAVGFLVAIAIGLIMFTIALYFFLADGPRLVESSKSLIPVDTAYQEELIDDFAKVVRTVVIATFLAAIGQGLATTLAIGVLGFHHLFALGALATFTALIPLMGTSLVWVPCAAWLFMHNRTTEGVILVLYCTLFVGFLDNLIRTYVLNSNVKLHPLLAFISVLGGIHAMGLWGVFIGPIVACCLYALIKIFNTELTEFTRERQEAETPGVTVSAAGTTAS
ncbi:AI-2E family transporter [Planctomicrobium piriforme]|uniref:Predicted PurR-regulated permease PerM n=1 Tax=Planctomicrobium piriforme TaxID=1576369 RepID=A0A1I3EQ97_9PLAN|nr:AI-2E family transporter [Planctomicrobium piriforme]SFI01078.1 Predicted PurR-regulated permease PerM [Planctomicrobium piriforme]